MDGIKRTLQYKGTKNRLNENSEHIEQEQISENFKMFSKGC
jgi:hypothetical protein